MRGWLLVGALVLLGCSDGGDGEDGTSTGGGEGGCPPGQTADANGTCQPGCPDDEVLDEVGACIRPGFPAGLCAAGEREIDGACVAPGVAPTDCPSGFVPDDGGCIPTLPATPCGPGLMAVPGESTCRPVADCGSGTWGNIPVDANSIYVDASHAGPSDGTAASPFSAIGPAVASSSDGALIAVAAGTYTGSVVLAGKKVTLWGRCPDMVRVVGDAVNPGAVTINAGADGSVIRGLALEGPNLGVGVFGSQSLTLDAIWVDAGDHEGIYLEDELSEIDLTLSNSLIELRTNAAIAAWGATVVVESSVLRGTIPGAGAAGVVALHSPNDDEPANVTLRGSLLEDNGGNGLQVLAGSAGTIERSAVTRTQPGGAEQGCAAWAYDEGATITVRQSTFFDNATCSLRSSSGAISVEDSTFLGSPTSGRAIVSSFRPDAALPELDVTRSRFRDHPEITVLLTSTIFDADALLVSDAGYGLVIEGNMGGTPSQASLNDLVLERTDPIAILVNGSVVTIDNVAIADATAPNALSPSRGEGLQVQLSLDTFVPSDVTVHGLLVERAGEAGVVVAGSSLVGEGIEVRDSQAVGGHSRGIQIQTFPSAPSVATTAELRSVLITDIDEVGVFAIGAELTLSSFVITNTVATAEGKFGDGLAILGHEGIGQADLRHGRVDDSARAALGVFGAVAEIVNLRMRCQAFDIAVDAYEGVLSTLTDGGDNTCGCGAEIRDCKALSSGLEPPEPI